MMFERILKDLTTIADPQERSLREQLARLMATGQYEQWQEARLVFADWLADHERSVEEAAARANWKIDIHRPSSSTPEVILRNGFVVPSRRFWNLHVPICFPQKRVMKRRLNSQWFLGFAPWTLHCTKCSIKGARFTWMPERKMRTFLTDYRVSCPLGFFSLWYHDSAKPAENVALTPRPFA